MTDARLRGEWLTAVAHDRLSDAAYRILHNALMHSAEQGTDGAIHRTALRYLYPTAIDPRHLAELEAAGFWTPTEDGYQLNGWSTTLGQSTAEQVERYRQNNRDRQARARTKARQVQNPTPPPEAVTAPRALRDQTRDVTRDVGKARTGQDRPGKDEEQRVYEWPTRPIPTEATA